MKTNTNHAKKVLVALFAMLLPLLAKSYDFEKDGLYFNILSSSEKTVEITSGDERYILGEITLPSSVSYKNVDFSVVKIGNNAFASATFDGITIPASIKTIGYRAFANTSYYNKPYYICFEGDISIDSEAFWTSWYGTFIFVNSEPPTLIDKTSRGYLFNCNPIMCIPNGANENLFKEFASRGSIVHYENSIDISVLKSLAFSQFLIVSNDFEFVITSLKKPYSAKLKAVKRADSHISLPSSVSYLNYNFIVRNSCENIFSEANNLEELIIPEGYISMDGSIGTCHSLKKIILPSTIEVLSKTFVDCPNLEHVESNIHTPFATDAFNTSVISLFAVLYVPASAIKNYKSTAPWSSFGTIVSLTEEKVTSITLNQSTATLTEGQTLTLIATVEPGYATNKAVTWSSTDFDVATVDNTGKVMAIAPGTAIITATANDGSGVSAQCEVTVKRTSVVITDPCNEDSFIQEVNKENVDISYTRKLSKTNTWYALYVPFEIPVTEELLDDYDVAYFNDIHSYDEYVGDKADGITGTDGVIDRMDMEVLRVQEGMTLNANYPYLIRAKHEDALNMNIEVENTTLYKSVENTVSCSSVFMKFDVTGIYTTQTAGELKGEFDVYAMSGGGWKQALNDEQQLKPFRLYLRLSTISGSPVKVAESAMKAIRIRVDGEDDTTGLEDSELKITDSKLIFDLQGRRVENPGKGIYIVNGKKTVIK